MKLVFPALLFLGALGLCLGTPGRRVRWCTISQAEETKCTKFQQNMREVGGPHVSCTRKNSRQECIQAIKANEADAVTLDGGLVFEAGLDPNKLRPVAAEVYGTQAAAANFFSASCVPCADGKEYPNLCRLCAGTGENKCACSSQEPYFGYAGAFKCLHEGGGDVAFVRHTTVFESLPDKADQDKYELLCLNNTRKPVDAFKECHLARIPSHAVVARSVDGKEDLIWELLNKAQEKFGKDKSPAFQLFGSPKDEKDLLFKDSALGFLRVPSKVDSGLYLGFNYLTAIQGLRETAAEVAERRARVAWCAVGREEERKCQQWSRASLGNVTCVSAPTGEDCIALVLKGEADALSLDGGLIYVAGKCGLVPVLAENQKPQIPNNERCEDRRVEGYLAVAVVRKSDADITWNSLRGRKSCHTAVDRTAGWNIPMGLLFSQTGSCKFGEFFSKSCAPGSDPNSNLCALCIGDERGENKCVPNSSERYFGYTGAFRCLAEKAGDVAFVKDSTVLQNTNGGSSEAWAKDLRLEDFELLCLDGTRKPVKEAERCHLARAPNHGVVSREDKAQHLEQVLLQQQTHFGTNGDKCPSEFCLFRSKTKNLLFNDNTECLAKLQGKTTYEEYLGSAYVTAVGNLRQCSTSHHSSIQFVFSANMYMECLACAQRHPG
uniref:Lactotransferrin n=1 Tax=Felis catus TaxID=9685 RepID=A0ABI7ZI51_FELCA